MQSSNRLINITFKAFAALYSSVSAVYRSDITLMVFLSTGVDLAINRVEMNETDISILSPLYNVIVRLTDNIRKQHFDVPTTIK